MTLSLFSATHSKAMLACGILMACAAQTHAQPKPLYLLVSAGSSTYSGNIQAATDAEAIGVGLTGISSTMGTRGNAYKAMLGYQLSPSFAIEGGFVDMGTFTYSSPSSGGNINADYRAIGFNASTLGFVELNGEVSLFGKLGVTFSSVKSAASINGVAISTSEQKSNLGYGFGGLYRLTDKVGLRAEWERLYGDVSLLSLGLQVRF